MDIKMVSKRYYLLSWLLILHPIPNSVGQRLSSGASDWYIRFHLVKRNVDRPYVKLFHVDSNIEHRYATTQVKVVIHNPAIFEQKYNFGMAMPNTAFVSKVQLWSQDGVLAVVANVERNSFLMQGRNNIIEAKKKQKQSGNEGDESLGPYGPLNFDFSIDFADFKQFILPINLKPMANLTMVLVYEELLAYQDGQCTQVLSISPGELVQDFAIRVNITEIRPLMWSNFTVPILGSSGGQSGEYSLNMSITEQSNIFGKHGFAGQFKVAYSVQPNEKHVDVIVKDGYFVHFYDIPETMKSIPKHVIILLDMSESMSGPKMQHAKDAITSILMSLSQSDFMNLITFNDTSYDWSPTALNLYPIKHEEVFRCFTNVTEKAIAYLENLQTSGISDMSKGVINGINTAQNLWRLKTLPENAHTQILLLTDGRSPRNRRQARSIRKQIRKANQITRIPITILGMGFDANMDFLENIAKKSRSFAVNINEDLKVEPQLRYIHEHLNDVVLKNLHLSYIGDVLDGNTITKKYFASFNNGSSIVISGKLASDPDSVFHPEFEVEVTGQSADGNYTKNLPTVSLLPEDQKCQGTITLCSLPKFNGKCLNISMSRANLKQYDFDNRAASIKISGNCAWMAFTEKHFSGTNITLLPGNYESIPIIHMDVSSIRIVYAHKPCNYTTQLSKSTLSLGKLWAHLTISNLLDKLEARPQSLKAPEISQASSLANTYQFLTPFTDLRFTQKNISSTSVSLPSEPNVNVINNYETEPILQDLVDDDLLTYNDLSPVLSAINNPAMIKRWEALEKCQAPVRCVGNFHVEEFSAGDDNKTTDQDELAANVSVHRLTLYTKRLFQGEFLNVERSVIQLYHSIVSQRIRSFETTGNGCWLIFERRFFMGDVEKVCGTHSETFREKNIGSVMLIEDPIYFP